MAKRKIVTLLTDFGTGDPYVAAMKGVILHGCPGAEFVDISHEVPAHNVLAGALVLGNAAPYFPPDTLHVAVVDPGVGTDRPILAGRFGGQTFLFPDNGIISVVASKLPLEGLVTVRNRQYLPPGPASATFHGRDVFAPVAAHILNGLDIRNLGTLPGRYTLLDMPAPTVGESTITGRVIYVDRFGNLITNLARTFLIEHTYMEELRVNCVGQDLGPLKHSYGYVAPGAMVALINSMGMIELAVNQGRACDVLGVGVGAEVCVGPLAGDAALTRKRV